MQEDWRNYGVAITYVNKTTSIETFVLYSEDNARLLCIYLRSIIDDSRAREPEPELNSNSVSHFGA